MDHKVLGVVRSARKRDELLKEVKDTVRKAVQAGMGGPGNEPGDEKMLKDAQQILEKLKDKKKQQEQAKETKLDLRARVQQALENGSEVRGFNPSTLPEMSRPPFVTPAALPLSVRLSSLFFRSHHASCCLANTLT